NCVGAGPAAFTTPACAMLTAPPAAGRGTTTSPVSPWMISTLAPAPAGAAGTLAVRTVTTGVPGGGASPPAAARVVAAREAARRGGLGLGCHLRRAEVEAGPGVIVVAFGGVEVGVEVAVEDLVAIVAFVIPGAFEADHFAGELAGGGSGGGGGDRGVAAGRG